MKSSEYLQRKCVLEFVFFLFMGQSFIRKWVWFLYPARHFFKSKLGKRVDRSVHKTAFPVILCYFRLLGLILPTRPLSTVNVEKPRECGQGWVLTWDPFSHRVSFLVSPTTLTTMQSSLLQDTISTACKFTVCIFILLERRNRLNLTLFLRMLTKVRLGKWACTITWLPSVVVQSPSELWLGNWTPPPKSNQVIVQAHLPNLTFVSILRNEVKLSCFWLFQWL